MDFSLSPEQESIRESIAKICEDFDDAYWLDRDASGDFPVELHKAARGGYPHAVTQRLDIDHVPRVGEDLDVRAPTGQRGPFGGSLGEATWGTCPAPGQ